MQASHCFPSDKVNLFATICFYTHAISLERKVVTEIGKIALQSISGFTNWFNVKTNPTGTKYLNFSSFCPLHNFTLECIRITLSALTLMQVIFCIVFKYVLKPTNQPRALQPSASHSVYP